MSYADPQTDLEVVRVNTRLLLGTKLAETFVPGCLNEAVRVADARWRSHQKHSTRTVERHVIAAVVAMIDSGYAQKAIAAQLGVALSVVHDIKIFLDLYRTRPRR